MGVHRQSHNHILQLPCFVCYVFLRSVYVGLFPFLLTEIAKLKKNACYLSYCIHHCDIRKVMTLASTGSAYPVTPVVGQLFFGHVCTSGFEELSVSLNSALQYPLKGCLKSRKCTRRCMSCIARSHSQALHLQIMRSTNGISFDP